MRGSRTAEESRKGGKGKKKGKGRRGGKEEGRGKEKEGKGRGRDKRGTCFDGSRGRNPQASIRELMELCRKGERRILGVRGVRDATRIN